MKKVSKLFFAMLLLSLTAAICFSAFGCGGYSLEDGSYTGTYKCKFHAEYTVTTTGPGAGTHTYTADYWGSVVTFDVKNNAIWNLTNAAPDPDGFSDNNEYATYINGGMTNTFLSQFSGWTLDEIMAVDIKLNESGYPVEMDAGGKNIVVAAGQDAGCAIVVLAIKEAITGNS